MNHGVTFTPATEKKFVVGEIYQYETGVLCRCIRLGTAHLETELRSLKEWERFYGNTPSDWTPLPPGTLTIAIPEDES